MSINHYEEAESIVKQPVKAKGDELSKVFAKPFTKRSFMRFVAPSVVTMLFISLYSIVDGIFVSNYAGSDALAALNIVYPMINVVFALAIMLSVGGCAITAIRMGEGEKDRADKTFSLVLLMAVVLSILLTVIVWLNLDKIVIFLGADAELFDFGMTYAGIITAFIPIITLKMIFENFIRTDGHANISLYVSVAGGVLNIILDYVFIVLMDMGIAGAAWGTVLGFLFSMILGVLYFFSKQSVLKIKKPLLKWRVMGNVLLNGSSQMVNELSLGLTTFVFNFFALKFAGADGVAALTIVMYAQFLLLSAFLGFGNGVAPILSYNFGAKLVNNLKTVVGYSWKIVVISSVAIFALAELLAPVIAQAFAGGNPNVLAIATNAMHLFAFAFLFNGFNILVVSLFTSFNNGKIAALLSFCRSFFFVFLWLLLLTTSLQITGLWLSIPFAEFSTILLAFFLFRRYRKIYQY